MEEQGVVDLLKKAKKAREKAETDATAWPECIKFYAEILHKYPNTVYLDRWEGPDKMEMWFKNGLYKSTRERVARDIASLPPAGLQIYREINDRLADPMYAEAVAHFDERKMEQVAQDFASASKGVPAMEWLAEVSYDGGGHRQAVARLKNILKSDTVAAHKTSLLARKVLSEIQLGDAAAAAAALNELKEAAANLANGPLRVGHSEGAAALEKLSQRVTGMAGANPATAVHDGGKNWDTYFGNAEHNRPIAARSNVGILRWSKEIGKLLYGPDYDATAKPDPNNPQPAVDVPTLNYHLEAHEGYFYLADSKEVIAYPIGLPKPGLPGKGGNAKFAWPGDTDITSSAHGTSAAQRRVRAFNGQMVGAAARQHPYFCTIANDRLYFAYGADAVVRDPNVWMGPGNELKQPPNYIVALGRQRAGGTLESGKLVWSLAPDSPTFQAQSKADQEWLRNIFFVHSPTYDSGVLYCQAIHLAGTTESWVAAIDADNGKLLWRTQVCAAQGYASSGPVQPDLGLPVTIANGTVYVCTNLGAVGALDAVSGNIKWIRVYDRVKTAADRWGQGGQQMPADFWGPNPPIVYNNLLIVTPQDSDRLYAYYTETGKDGEKEVEAGQRKYEILRNSGNEDASTGGLKHFLGTIHGNMVITGSSVHFYDIKSGKKSGPYEAFTLDSPIHGRGVVTEDQVLIPTEKALVRIDAPMVNGKFSPKLREDSYKWEDGKAEAGNIFIAGDVLYTVSHTHVNAYLVWEDMEKKLAERLAKDPNDLDAFKELADVYLRVEHYDQALAQIEKGEAAAEKVKSDPKTPALLAALRCQKFDALFALGEKTQKPDDGGANENKKAYEYYKKALETSLLPDVTPEYPIVALRAMAENALMRGDAATAVAHYQEMMVKHGDIVYTFEKGGSKRSRLFAQSRIDEIKKKNPGSYDKIEAEALEAAKKAGTDTAALQAVISTYPNSNACGNALLQLAQSTLSSDPDRSRQYVREFLNRFGTSADASLGFAILAASQERTRMVAAAKDTLYRILGRNDDPSLAFNPLDPKSALDKPMTVKQWAEARLKEPQFQGFPSAAAFSMGQAKLKEGWSTKNTGAVSVAVVGMSPQSMRRNLIYIENQNELVVISGREKGDELWTPHPKLPSNCRPQALWADRLLVMYGDHEIIAYDSKDKGNVVWKHSYKAGLAPLFQPQASPDGQKIIVTYPGGTVSIVDAGSGNELWYTQIEGAELYGWPAPGDNCVAIAGKNPAKVIIYNLDTGAKRGVIEVSSGSLTASPIVHTDRLYLAEKDNQVRAYDTNTGKLLWAQQCEGDVRSLVATRDLLFGQLSDKTVIAMKTQGDNHGPWNPLLDTGAKVRGFYVDAEDLYVITDEPSKQGGGRLSKLVSYSIPKQGKLQWEQDVSNEWVGNLLLTPGLFTTQHVILAQATWDPTNSKSSAVVLVDRKTGKLTFDQSLSSDRNAGNLPFSVQVFDGGLVVSDGKKRTAYVSPDIDSLDDDLKGIEAKLAAKPNDPDLTLRWAKLTYDKGDHEKALSALAAVLKTDLNDEKFAAAYEEFARLRRDDAIKNKQTLKFVHLDKAPKLDGTLADWAKVPEQKFDSWRDIYLASEEGTGALAKKNLWKGGDDLSVRFRGGYDDRNLYLLFVVKDDQHKNEQTEARLCDLGDSITLMFDSNNDGGVAFRGEEFSLGSGLNKEGKLLAWRWVEHGKYLPGSTPLENGAFAARNEPDKTTIYQFALPLESLSLKPEAGKSFGFSFAVHDQDGVEVEKSAGSSPGVLSPPEPRLFSKGSFEK